MLPRGTGKFRMVAVHGFHCMQTQNYLYQGEEPVRPQENRWYPELTNVIFDSSGETIYQGYE